MVQNTITEPLTLVSPHVCNAVSDQFESTNEMTLDDAQRLLWELSDLVALEVYQN